MTNASVLSEKNISFSSYEQPIRISNFTTIFFLFIYFLRFFYLVKVSIEIKIHHKMPICIMNYTTVKLGDKELFGHPKVVP